MICQQNLGCWEAGRPTPNSSPQAAAPGMYRCATQTAASKCLYRIHHDGFRALYSLHVLTKSVTKSVPGTESVTTLSRGSYKPKVEVAMSSSVVRVHANAASTHPTQTSAQLQASAYCWAKDQFIHGEVRCLKPINHTMLVEFDVQLVVVC